MATFSTIFDATAACRRSLEACLAIPCLMENEWAENQLADFNLWSAGAGASARERASLDRRLVLDPDVGSVVINLLCMLNGFIDRCKQEASIISGPKATNPTSYELGSTQGQQKDSSFNLSITPSYKIPNVQGGKNLSKDQLEASEKVLEDRKNVEKTLHQIVRLTVAIRKAGSHAKFQKADNSFDPGDHMVLKEHLEVVILAKPSEEDRETLHLNTDQLNPIQLRLIEANLRRRNRFLYAQRHSKKLAEIRDTHDEKHSSSIGMLAPRQQSPNLDASTKQISSQSDAKIHDAEITGRGQVQPPHTLTATSVSAVDVPIKLPAEESSQPSMTVISSTGSRIVYPRPPRIKSSQKIFKCPCCCKALPTYFSEGNKWRKHLMGDILPYTCIIDDCPNPWNFYLTRETWMNHMKEEHKTSQYWVCFACRSRNEFHDRNVFISHLQTKHQGMSAEQISTFLSACSRSIPIEIRSCPLCFPEAPGDHKGNVDHIAEHVHSFSLRSLPWAPSDGNVSDDETYFLDNDYFGGDSAHTSSGNTLSSGIDDRDSEGLPELSFEDDEDTGQDGSKDEQSSSNLQPEPPSSEPPSSEPPRIVVSDENWRSKLPKNEIDAQEREQDTMALEVPQDPFRPDSRNMNLSESRARNV